jgi:hypothetical protein
MASSMRPDRLICSSDDPDCRSSRQPGKSNVKAALCGGVERGRSIWPRHQQARRSRTDCGVSCGRIGRRTTRPSSTQSVRPTPGLTLTKSSVRPSPTLPRKIARPSRCKPACAAHRVDGRYWWSHWKLLVVYREGCAGRLSGRGASLYGSSIQSLAVALRDLAAISASTSAFSGPVIRRSLSASVFGRLYCVMKSSRE